jgi:hypothetical protein
MNDMFPGRTTRDAFVAQKAPVRICVNSEFVSNKIDESERHNEKYNEQRI